MRLGQGNTFDYLDKILLERAGEGEMAGQTSSQEALVTNHPQRAGGLD